MIAVYAPEETTVRFNTPPIEVDPEKMSGKVCIADTRMPVEDFLIHLQQGGSIHTFREDHDWLEVDQLKAVLAFATEDLGNDPRAAERARAMTVTHDQSDHDRAEGVALG